MSAQVLIATEDPAVADGMSLEDGEPVFWIDLSDHVQKVEINYEEDA